MTTAGLKIFANADGEIGRVECHLCGTDELCWIQDIDCGDFRFPVKNSSRIYNLLIDKVPVYFGGPAPLAAHVRIRLEINRDGMEPVGVISELEFLDDGDYVAVPLDTEQ